MTFRRLTVVAAAVMVAAGGAAVAQTLPEPMVQAARKAVVSNPEVQARWHNFKATSAERDVARAGYRPQVDLQASIGREWRSTASDYGRRGAALSLNQMLFDGFFTRNEVKRLGYSQLTRYYELQEASETAALEAVRAYADVARYTALVEQAKQNYVEHKLTNQQIEERAGAGVSRRVDLEQATGRLALAESNLLTEVSNLHDVSARYLRIVGELPPTNVAELAEGLKLAGVPDTAVDAMRQGLPNSPTINAAYENVRATKAQVASRQAAYMPRIDFRARQTWDRNLDGVLGHSRDTTVEVVLNYNLFRGGGDMAREMEALEFQNQARDLQEKACRDVRQTLQIAYNDVGRLREQLEYLDQHRLSTEKAKEAYRQQFEIGQRTLLDLLDTQNEYFEASRAFINSQYNEFIAQARTLSSMGKLTAALGVSRPDQPSAEDVGQDRGELPPEELCPFDMPPVLEVDKAKAVAAMPARPRVEAAPAAPAAPAQQASTKLTLSSDALFDFDKAVLKAEGRKNLDELVQRIKGVQLDVVIAVGHTDAIGSDAYNMGLSLRRAEAVKAYLVNQGIPADQIRTEGKGKTQPVASNATAEGRSQNRRVEIDVIEVVKN